MVAWQGRSGVQMIGNSDSARGPRQWRYTGVPSRGAAAKAEGSCSRLYTPAHKMQGAARIHS